MNRKKDLKTLLFFVFPLLLLFLNPLMAQDEGLTESLFIAPETVISVSDSIESSDIKYKQIGFYTLAFVSSAYRGSVEKLKSELEKNAADLKIDLDDNRIEYICSYYKDEELCSDILKWYRIVMHERTVDLNTWAEDLKIWRMLGDHPIYVIRGDKKFSIFHDDATPYSAQEVVDAYLKVEREYLLDISKGKRWKGSEYSRNLFAIMREVANRSGIDLIKDVYLDELLSISRVSFIGSRHYPVYQSLDAVAQNRENSGSNSGHIVSVAEMKEHIGSCLTYSDINDLLINSSIYDANVVVHPDSLSRYADETYSEDWMIEREDLDENLDRVNTLTMQNGRMVLDADEDLKFKADLMGGFNFKVKVSKRLEYTVIHHERISSPDKEASYNFALRVDKGKIDLSADWNGIPGSGLITDAVIGLAPGVDSIPPIHKAEYLIVFTDKRDIYMMILKRDGDKIKKADSLRNMTDSAKKVSLENLSETAKLAYDSLLLRVEWDNES